MAIRYGRDSDLMEAGERDQSITIEQRPATDALDGMGAPTDGPWTTLVDRMPASKMDLEGAERFRSDQLSARFDTRWEFNYRADMDPDLLDVPKLRRIVHQSRVYNIVEAKQIGRRVGVRLMTLAQAG